jgi:hypothetical protein
VASDLNRAAIRVFVSFLGVTERWGGDLCD